MSDWVTEELKEKMKSFRKKGDVEKLTKKVESNTNIIGDGKRMFKKTNPIKTKKKKNKAIPKSFKSIYWLDYKG